MSEDTIKTNRQTAKDISREWFCLEHLEEKIFMALQIAQNRGKAIADRSEAIQMEAIQHLVGRSHPSQIRNVPTLPEESE